MFENLPQINPNRIAFKVKTSVERIIRQQEHPWVFDQGIRSQKSEGEAGDLAIIFDHKKNKFLALGLYDPFSPIRIKLLQFKKGATINKDWFAQKITTAYKKRQSLLETDTNSYRLIYGENDGLPSFIADVYDTVLVVKLYALIWLPYLKMMFPLLMEVSKCKTLVLRLSRSVEKEKRHLHGLFNGQVFGTLENEEIIFREHGVLFSANVIHGHKTGYFLDHRHNRKKVGELAKNKTVLDVFAYAGGFSVHALVGGAKSVTSLDISKQALAMAQKNVALNLKNANHHILAVDAFEGLQNLINKRNRFDIVVIDPPSFAKQASEVNKAIYSYRQLTKLGVQLVASNGILVMASCSSRVEAAIFFENVIQELEDANCTYQELGRTYHDMDHPIGFKEGAYLKCGYFQILHNEQ
jgi:23S rRNA (cytosine1962-C5)-methyltransferase